MKRCGFGLKLLDGHLENGDLLRVDFVRHGLARLFRLSPFPDKRLGEATCRSIPFGDRCVDDRVAIEPSQRVARRPVIDCSRRCEHLETTAWLPSPTSEVARPPEPGTSDTRGRKQRDVLRSTRSRLIASRAEYHTRIEQRFEDTPHFIPGVLRTPIQRVFCDEM